MSQNIGLLGYCSGISKYIVFLGGINSHSPTQTGDSSSVKESFKDIRRELEQSAVGSHFVYFSYGAANDQQLSIFYCNGWGADACTGGKDFSDIGDLKDLERTPVYTKKDTRKPIDQQVDVLEWLRGQIVQRDQNAQIDLVGFSLGGIVASRWAATRGEQSPHHNNIHSIVLLNSPVGGFPVAGELLDYGIPVPLFNNETACLFWGGPTARNVRGEHASRPYAARGH
jgi:pimeloyl-ACP methyl ester carboxylesterase